ncbi:uncharacterized protein LOC131019041 [Salvia miltiorrhiza]|uniref:uncharacterized protein LOC131019041 n=1 Tax=Salvia miltiorrhiza TaxID=226208 RepID=UPI0025AD1A8A|nr:uncharacterized protein LOC131019041 [Salvia miltiorrhiza]
MTLDRIVSEFEECYGSKPKLVYAADADYTIDKGLVPLRNPIQCHKVLDYLELLGHGEIAFYADHEVDPMPTFVVKEMFLEETENSDLEGKHGVQITGEDKGVQSTDGGVEDGEDVELEEEDEAELEEGDDVELEEEEEAEVEEGDEGEVRGREHGDDDNSSVYSECWESDDDVKSLEQLVGSVEGGEEGSFQLGMTFAGAKEARDSINAYAVKFGYKLKFLKNEKTRIRVVCINDQQCPFLMHVSKDGDIEGLGIKTLVADHTCCKQREVPSASQSYLAKYFKGAIYRNPRFTSKDMQGHVKDHLKLHVSLHKCKRAKKEIICKLEGSYKEEFNRLVAYCNIVKECMPGSKMELQLSTEHIQNQRHVFKRIFVMLEPCRLNWLGGCRPIICLDGCHLKGKTFGCLLTAVGKDGNDGIVPIAWAVVNKENKNNWKWFLMWLRQELNLGAGDEVTLMSDMQKGLMEAVKEVTPAAEHRWCARHIYANWSKKWRGEELKKRFWATAWSSFQQKFKFNLAKVSAINKKAVEDLLHYPTENWCKAYQSTRCSTYMVDNNISESFNSSISDARHKPIISMLEEIRMLVMSRIKDRKQLVDHWKTEWCPKAMQMFEANKAASMNCNVLWNGDYGYEVEEGEDKHIVFVDTKKCSCRMWDLSGIPCPHAIAAFYSSQLDPLSVMSNWYHSSMYRKSYEHAIQPIPGYKFWDIQFKDYIEAPPVEKKIGRPKKNRVRASNEPRLKHKLSRIGKTQHCSICGSASHKKHKCPERPTQDSTTTKLAKKQRGSITGVGLYVNIETGKQILNPGGSQSVVIDEGSQKEADPNTRFPIPNEAEIKRGEGSSSGVTGKGKKHQSKPFKAPRGKTDAVDQELVLRRSPRRQNVISTVGSTSTN